MEILGATLAVVIVLGTIWVLLTRRRRKVKRVWSWRRIYLRTLDYLVADYVGERALILLILAPFLPQLLGHGRSILGFSLSAIIALTIAIIAIQRTAKWMPRASRPVDQLRQSFEDRVLSREYRSTAKKKKRS
jgi:hypothetical protein